eukprot:264279_1
MAYGKRTSYAMFRCHIGGISMIMWRVWLILELGTHTLESIQNIFVAKVSLEMTQQSNNLASVGGKLASVGAVFLPLTVITGIWGMNCRVPFQFNPDGAAFFDDNLVG